jgi:hypothetical protein
MAGHDHSHGHHEQHGSDKKAALIGLFAGIIFVGLVVYGISVWTSSLFAGHG